MCTLQYQARLVVILGIGGETYRINMTLRLGSVEASPHDAVIQSTIRPSLGMLYPGLIFPTPLLPPNRVRTSHTRKRKYAISNAEQPVTKPTRYCSVVAWNDV